jgi:hypothetical protein
MYLVEKEDGFFFLIKEDQYLQSPNGHDLKSKDETLMKAVADFANEQGEPELGEVNIYNLFLTLVDNYPEGNTTGKAHLRKQLWRDPVFHLAQSKELEEGRTHLRGLISSWYLNQFKTELPELDIDEEWEDEEEEIIYFPKEDLQIQWTGYLKLVNAFEDIYNGFNLRQKTIIACLSQTFDAFHICLYIMFVKNEISSEDLADMLFVAFDLPMETIGHIEEGAAQEDRALNFAEFEVYQAFLNI